MQRLSINVAMTPERVIGRDGGLPWHLPNDLKRFKQITMGHAIIMGRKTYDSIGRALPGRTNIVVTRQPDWQAPGIVRANSFDEALELSREDSEPFIIGGHDLFALALPRATRLYMTMVHAEVLGDVYFPPIDWNGWTMTFSEHHAADDRHPHPYTFQIHERIEMK